MKKKERQALVQEMIDQDKTDKQIVKEVMKASGVTEATVMKDIAKLDPPEDDAKEGAVPETKKKAETAKDESTAENETDEDESDSDGQDEGKDEEPEMNDNVTVSDIKWLFDSLPAEEQEVIIAAIGVKKVVPGVEETSVLPLAKVSPLAQAAADKAKTEALGDDDGEREGVIAIDIPRSNGEKFEYELPEDCAETHAHVYQEQIKFHPETGERLSKGHVQIYGKAAWEQVRKNGPLQGWTFVVISIPEGWNPEIEPLKRIGKTMARDLKRPNK